MSLRLLAILFSAALLALTAPAAAQPAPPAAENLAPTNPAAAGPAVKLRVSQAGVQRVTGAALAAAGLDLASTDPALLWLRLRGQPVALELRGAEDGRIDPADELRFFAASPGDRWNAADTYWLTAEGAPGSRITSRDAGGAAPQRATAIDRGTLPGAARYDSTSPGVDGDRWFAADLRVGPDLPPAAVTLPLTPSLPLAGGALTLRLTGSAYLPGPHTLEVRGGGAQASVTWSGTGPWSQSLTLSANVAPVTLALVSPQADGVLLDSIGWERPVSLSFGGSGALFTAPQGTHRYQLSGLPPGAELYDVSDPRAPVRVALSGGAFTADAGVEGRAFALAGPGALHEPAAVPHAPRDMAAPLDADALYVGPAELHAALEPLLAQRRAQGYTPAAVDVQAIYDAWSYGQVTPEAIRSFLRYAASAWSRRPVAVTLVGDGSSDPLDRTRRGAANVSLVPPYLAPVDPWLGETACETCYAQLDGPSPLDDPLPDLLIGRLPVKSAAELTGLVAKIVAYETAPTGQAWQRRQVFITDNYREADGAIDRAGDFAAVADDVIGRQPAGVVIERVYFDPLAPAAESWRVADARDAQARARAAIDAGAGVVTYLGHSSMWQWSSNVYQPDPNQPQQLLPLISLYDPDTLTNRDRLPVVLSMTCLSSAFQTPAFSGTTLDERMLLNPNGGAVAVWGPTGLGVLYGHDALMRGFFRALHSGAPSGPAARDWRAVGSLVHAGYLALYTETACCRDALRTFALLGDPLTPLRAAERRVFLPLSRR